MLALATFFPTADITGPEEFNIFGVSTFQKLEKIDRFQKKNFNSFVLSLKKNRETNARSKNLEFRQFFKMLNNLLSILQNNPRPGTGIPEIFHRLG